MPGGTVFMSEILPATAPNASNPTPTVSVGDPTVGTSISGALITGPAYTYNGSDITDPLDPLKTISNVSIIGNSTCGTIQFDSHEIDAGTIIALPFPGEFVYQTTPILLGSPANSTGSNTWFTGQSSLYSEIDQLSGTINCVIAVTKNVDNGSLQTSKISYAAFALSTLQS